MEVDFLVLRDVDTIMPKPRKLYMKLKSSHAANINIRSLELRHETPTVV